MLMHKDERDTIVGRITRHYNELMKSLKGEDIEDCMPGETILYQGKRLRKDDFIEIDKKEIGRCIDILNTELKHILK